MSFVHFYTIIVKERLSFRYKFFNSKLYFALLDRGEITLFGSRSLKVLLIKTVFFTVILPYLF